VISSPESRVIVRVIPLTKNARSRFTFSLTQPFMDAAKEIPDDASGRSVRQARLVVGIANEHSIAAGCAAAFARCGASLAATYLNDKAKPFVAPVAEKLGVDMLLPCDVRAGRTRSGLRNDPQEWGRLDFVLHSIAFARMTTCSGGSSTARPKALPWPWMSRATVSCAWPIWPNR
jgi:hypothetical protein